MAGSDQEKLMVRIAYLYYHEGLTHERIAKKLRMSRVAVTRLLQKAREEEIVQIRITRALPLEYELETALEKTFHLKKAIVVNTASSREDTLDAIGGKGAEHLREVLYPHCRVGFTWSTTISRMAPYLTPLEQPFDFFINDLAGTLMGNTNVYGISWRVAQVMGGYLEVLPVPLVVSNREVRDAILREQGISKALKNAKECDIAFLGLGSLGPDCTLARTGFLNTAQIEQLTGAGAVGDLLMQFFDRSGRLIPSPVGENLISLDWESFRRIPYIVTLVAGPDKVEPVIGAMNGGFVHCLITDTDTAQRVLKYDREADTDFPQLAGEAVTP